VRDLRGRRHHGKERRAERRQSGRLKVGIDIPTPAEIKAIIKHLESGSRWRALLITAIFSGLRASELRGLRWSDVDLDKREIHVRQRADRFNQIGRPKSEAGERTVPVPPLVVKTLEEWKPKCPKGELNLVFPNGAGNVESHANIINRGLIPIQLAAGVTAPILDGAGKPRRDGDGNPIMQAKYTGLHSLRHWYASWCINRQGDAGLGLPAKIVQERMGHSSITMTMDTYGHLFPRGDDAEELAAAERALLS
jgi:integrase